MSKRLAVAILLSVAVGLSGCQSFYPGGPVERGAPEIIERGAGETPPPTAPGKPQPTPRRVERKIAFPADEYADLRKTGAASISGRLSLAGAGGTIAGAGEAVSVAPVTSYSAEAAEQALAGRAVTPADPRAREYTHTARTNDDGYFVLRNLPSGTFYVLGSMVDPATGKRRVAIQQVSLSKGQKKEVQLRP
ncbi:MAG TPA: carboxypeptidase-like regulatory domain-containing protein [Halomonas sp.]|nr:carboxypeptidase-like regulatory domain-containing protein [Halomonas sp.]